MANKRQTKLYHISSEPFAVAVKIMTKTCACDDSQLWLIVPQTKQQAASLKLSRLPLL